MTESRCLEELTATLYIRELMKFVVHQHGIEWNELGFNEMAETVPRIFQEDVGKIVVAYAKSKEKGNLMRQGETMRSIQTVDQYYSYCIQFQYFFFQHRGHTPYIILKYFVHAIENSILLYTQGLLDAPVLTVDVIVYALMTINGGCFLRNGGLESLNETAVSLLAEDPSLITYYETGTLAW